MTKDDKNMVKNVIIFCVIFSIVFTGYRIISLTSKNDNESAEKEQVLDNKTVVDNKSVIDNVSEKNNRISSVENQAVEESITKESSKFTGIADPLDEIDMLLYQAGIKGDFDDVKRYVAMGADINTSNKNGDTIINSIMAMKEVNMDITNCFRYLLIKGAKTDKRNEEGYTPLLNHLKNELFNEQLLDILLKYKADINQTDYDGKSPLHYAAASGELNRVKYFVEHGSNINPKDRDGITPLHIATVDKNYDIVSYLLSKKADKLSKDMNGVNPFDIAKASGDVDLLKIYGITDADIERDKRFNELKKALEIAKDKPAVKEISNNVLKGYMNKAVITGSGNSSIGGRFVGENPTPLIVSLYFGYDNISKALVNAGADINKAGGYPYYTPLMAAVSLDNIDMVNYLVERGADVNYRSKNDGMSAINCASSKNIAEILLQVKADPNNSYGAECISPLQQAVINNNYDLAEILIKYKADVNYVDCSLYKPVIAHAIDTGNPALIKLLLDNGAGVMTEVGEDLKTTVLQYAEQKGNPEIINMIKEKAAKSQPEKKIDNKVNNSLIKNNISGNNIKNNEKKIENKIENKKPAVKSNTGSKWDNASVTNDINNVYNQIRSQMNKNVLNNQNKNNVKNNDNKSSDTTNQQMDEIDNIMNSITNEL